MNADDEGSAELRSRISELVSAFESYRMPLLHFMQSMISLKEEFGGFPADDRLGTAVVVSRDRHAEGRDLIAILLESEGFRIKLFDKNDSLEKVVEVSRGPEVTAVCISVVTNYSCLEIYALSRKLREAGIRDRIVFNAGGAPVNEIIANEAGCDVFSKKASETVSQIKQKVLEKAAI